MDQDTFNTFKKELDNDIYTHKETMKRILHDIGWQPTKITSVEVFKIIQTRVWSTYCKPFKSCLNLLDGTMPH